MEDVKNVEGFFKSLFDFSFSSFITSRVIKILYILFVLGAALGALGIIVGGFSASVGTGLFTLIIGGPLVFLIWVISARVGLEIILVVFRIGEDLDELKKGKQE